MPIINKSLRINVIPAGKLESSHREVTHCTAIPSMDAGFRLPCRNDVLIKTSLTTEHTENKNNPSVYSVLSVSKASNNVLIGELYAHHKQKPTDKRHSSKEAGIQSQGSDSLYSNAIHGLWVSASLPK